MNKYYFIVPAVLLAAFVVLYRGAVKGMEEREHVRIEKIAAEKAADDARRKKIEDAAAADAAKRQKDREEEDRKKEEKKERDYQDAMKKLKDETSGYSAEADKFVKEANALEIELANLRTQKEDLNREVFNLAKAVELAKVDRRNAELEIQRMVEMVGSKVGMSSLATLPPPAPTGSK